MIYLPSLHPSCPPNILPIPLLCLLSSSPHFPQCSASQFDSKLFWSFPAPSIFPYWYPTLRKPFVPLTPSQCLSFRGLRLIEHFKRRKLIIPKAQHCAVGALKISGIMVAAAMGDGHFTLSSLWRFSIYLIISNTQSLGNALFINQDT